MDRNCLHRYLKCSEGIPSSGFPSEATVVSLIVALPSTRN